MKKGLLYLFILIIFVFLSACASKASFSVDPNNEQKENINTKEERAVIEDEINGLKDSFEKSAKTPTNDNDVLKDYVTYDGPIEHIFFHPLVVYPSLAFDGDHMSQGYNDYFVTVKEFNSIIESLYSKNYILIKMSDVFEETNLDGKEQLIKKELKLPKDKKPLIISVDDINYYPYMISNGNAYKLIINSEGKIATYSKDLSGNEVISEENEIVPLLNSFVEKHPDFSLNGAKGILALTGYEGVLGYRTNDLDSPSYEIEKNAAMQVINKLKNEGWEFASHGYGHLDTANIDLNTLKNDTNRWLNEVSPLIGETLIYIYPFGSSVLPDDPKFDYLQSVGFRILCSVGPNPYLKYTDAYTMMDRVHIDGISLETQQHILNRFFDSDALIDQQRFINQ